MPTTIEFRMQGLKEETVMEISWANLKHDARDGDSTEGLTNCDKGAGSIQHREHTHSYRVQRWIK